MAQTLKLGPFTAALPGFGAMGLSAMYGETKDEESKKVLRHAIDIGCTFWNTATVYGEDQHNEKLIGQVLREDSNRSKVVITTKWGLSSKGPDGSAAFAHECIENSKKNLGSYPDIWLLHRVDDKVDIEESVKAMEDARQAGKCTLIGLSGMSAATLRRANKVAKIDVVEMEWSPTETGIETNGVIDACKELGVVVFAYSPLGAGFLTGRFKSHQDFKKDGDVRGNGMFPRMNEENFDANYALVEALKRIAEKKGCTSAQLALAWDAQVHPGLIVPIPGTKSIKRLDENWASRDVALTKDELREIRAAIEKNPMKGDQLSEAHMKHLNR